MALGAKEQAWDHTAELLAGVYNIFRKQPLTSDQFHPYRRKKLTKARTSPANFVAMLALATGAKTVASGQ